MTAAGWIVMITAVSAVTGLLAFCIAKVLKTPGSEEHLHSPVDIRTPDVDEPE
ncbi:hypothetical protein JCM19992_14970 [Thermostilla marina]